MLAVIETHPIQYHAPVYRALQARCGVPVTVIYGSDFSVVGYRDREFEAEFSWDTDLLSGYASVFLSRVQAGAAGDDEPSARGLREALRQVRPTAVMVVGYSPHFHRAAWFETWRAGYPLLFRAETNDQARMRGGMRARLRALALTVAYRRCARLLFIGQRSRDHFRQLGVPEEKLVFSPYCVDTAPFHISEAAREPMRGATRRDIGAVESDVVVIYAGKLSERKGVDRLVDAVRRLDPALRERILVLLVGDGHLRSELAALAAVAPRVRVVFAGFRNQRELSRYYHAADVLVLASRHSETWGLVVNEALHHGVPCLVSDQVGCAPDLIDEGITGTVFHQADGDASLVSALQRVQSMLGRPDVREACRRKAGEYSVDRAAEGIAEAYAAVSLRAGASAA